MVGKVERARRLAEQGIRDAAHVIEQQKLKHAFHRGQLDILNRFEVHEKHSAVPASPARDTHRKRRFGRKPRRNTRKSRLLDHLLGQPGATLEFNGLSEFFAGNNGTLRTYLNEFAATGLIEFEANTVVVAQRE